MKLIGRVGDRKNQNTLTYPWNGINGAGPTKLTPTINISPPITAIVFGCKYLSHNQPHPGAEEPYVAPVTINTNPTTTGVKWY